MTIASPIALAPLAFGATSPLPNPTLGSFELPLAPLDLFGAAVVLILVLLGLWRGLWWQVIRLVGIVAAVALARALSDPVAGALADRWSEDVPARILFGLAWFLVFLLSLGAATLLGHLGQKLLNAMQLGLANRVGGALVGAATGLLVHLAILVGLVQLAPEDFVGRVVAGTFSERLVDAVGTGFPAVLSVEAGEQVKRVLDEVPRGKRTSEGPARTTGDAAAEGGGRQPSDPSRPRVR